MQLTIATLNTREIRLRSRTRLIVCYNTVLQNDDLNESAYPTTVILSLTTSLIEGAEPLRLCITKREKLQEDSDILIAQIRAIDNDRVIEKLSALTTNEVKTLQHLLDEVLS